MAYNAAAGLLAIMEPGNDGGKHYAAMVHYTAAGWVFLGYDEIISPDAGEDSPRKVAGGDGVISPDGYTVGLDGAAGTIATVTAAAVTLSGGRVHHLEWAPNSRWEKPRWCIDDSMNFEISSPIEYGRIVPRR